jgi:hypothetical protein
VPLYNFPPYILDVILDFGFQTIPMFEGYGPNDGVDGPRPLVDGQEETTARVTVLAPYVRSQSIIVCSPMGIPTADHDPEDVVVENIAAYGLNIVPGVSFDIMGYAPTNTWGKYLIRVSIYGYISMQG